MLALGVAVQVGAAPRPAQSNQRAADEQVAKIGDPARYLAGQRAKVAAAKSGEHGKISANDVRRLEAAERDIERLLAGRQNLNDLDAGDASLSITPRKPSQGSLQAAIGRGWCANVGKSQVPTSRPPNA